MNLPNGHLLQNGKYRLTHVVGQGGFGITYRGVWFTEVKGPLGTVKTEVPVCVKEYFFKDYCYRDTNTFAVKVHSETGKNLFDKFKEKLIKEAKILSEVHHPYIVNVLEVFEENNTAYIAMEYISGYSLKYQMEKEGILPEAKVLKYVRQIGTALQFVHDKSILHLDIKPSNILLDKNDNARLIDFGVSKRYDIEQQETSTTMLTLSKGFASIEQYDGEGTQSFSPCPDIYSLGATMYNLLTGKIPTESILRAARPLCKPSELNPLITPKTEVAIMKAMEIIPADRFQTIGEMLEALDFPPIEEPALSSSLLSNKVDYPTEVGGETTLMYNSDIPSSNDEEDQTVVNTQLQENVYIPPKKKRKGLLITTVVTIFATFGTAIAFWVHKNKPGQEMGETVLLPSDPLAMNEPMDQEVQIIPTDRSDVVDQKVDNQVIEKQKTPTDKPKERQEISSEQKPGETTRPVVEEPSEAEINAKYADLIAAGKAKMAEEEYVVAKDLFTMAKNTKLTEEVVRLIISCDAKAEEKRITDRKALYEEKMDFGKYKIVRKKASGKYGAIDAKGEERIPCKYLSVGKADNGRAFEREDSLFDIYKSDGTLAKKGATDY